MAHVKLMASSRTVPAVSSSLFNQLLPKQLWSYHGDLTCYRITQLGPIKLWVLFTPYLNCPKRILYDLIAASRLKGWGNFCHSITSDRSKYGRIKNGLTCPHGIVKNNSATPCDFTNNLLRRVADTERSVSLKRRKEEGPRNGDVRQTSER